MNLHRFFLGSVRRQLVFGVAAVHAVMMSLFVWDLASRQRDFLLLRQTEQAESLAQTLAVSAASGLLTHDVAGMQELINAQNDYPGMAFVMLLDAQGRVMAHNQPGRVGLYIDDIQRVTSATANTAAGKAVLLSKRQALVDTAMPVKANGQRIGWARVGLGQGETIARVHAVARDGLIYTAVAILVGALLASWMGRRMTAKLYAIRRVSAAVRDGRLTRRAPLLGEDEVGQLGLDFNHMLDAMSRHESDLARFKHALDEHAIVSIADTAGDIVYANDKLVTISGFSREELLGANHRLLNSGVHPPAFFQDMWRTISKGATWHGEICNRAKDGHLYWVLSTIVPFKGIDGQVEHYIAIRADISARKAAEQALYEEKEQAQVTLASIGDAVVTTDGEARVTFLNPVAERLTGWSNPAARGRLIGEVLHLIREDTRAPVANPVDLCRERGEGVNLAHHTVLLKLGGGELAIEDSAAPIMAKDGQLAGVVMVFRDVSDQRAMAHEMAWQLSHDSLTGLTNRREFERRMQALLACTDPNVSHALLFLDLDQFKIVNDTCGHLAGDELLKRLSVMLQGLLRGGDVLARLGGDEFGVLLENCPLEQARVIAEKLRLQVRNFEFFWGDKRFEVGVSIGVAPIDGATSSIAEITAAADMACYAAKEHGRNRIHVHASDDLDMERRHKELHAAGAIRAALEEDRFMLFGQEIRAINGKDGGENIEHYEVLLRLRGEDGSLQPPALFIPAAERYGLMVEIDRWVVRNTFTFLTRHPHMYLAINLSGLSLQDDSLASFITQTLINLKVDASHVCFEITETAAISHLGQAVAFIRDLRTWGFRFSLDDFGSGMSSFAYLKNLPVDFLKIDGTFVRDIVGDPIDRAFVETINHIGHVMGIKTIAEFVESEEILRELERIGVDYAQGFSISKPMPLASIAR